MRISSHRQKKLSACVMAVAFFAGASSVFAQHAAPAAPYASIGSKGVTYAGPGREAGYDLAGPTIRIGLLAPLHGPQQADGKAIIRAAQMALLDASKQPLPGGVHLALSIADESVPPWGLLGDEIIHFVMQDKVVAILTCADGVAAHLSMQIGNKIGVPTLTLSGDDSTTEINMPWIFRIGPSDAQQAQAMARNIYQSRGFKRVLLVSGLDHDGHIASREFTQEVRKLGASAPDSLLLNPLQPDIASVLATIRQKSPQAVVLWTQSEVAKELIQEMKSADIHVPIYLSQETAQIGSGLKFHRLQTAGVKDPSAAGIYTVASTQDKAPLEESFTHRYQLATGDFPSSVAAEAYDAVRLIAKAVRETGPNRARVRDRVSAIQNFAGVSGTISFDDQGNNRTNVSLVCLP